MWSMTALIRAGVLAVLVPTTSQFRGDSHYARPEAMEWCEANGIDARRRRLREGAEVDQPAAFSIGAKAGEAGQAAAFERRRDRRLVTARLNAETIFARVVASASQPNCGLFSTSLSWRMRLCPAHFASKSGLPCDSR